MVDKFIRHVSELLPVFLLYPAPFLFLVNGRKRGVACDEARCSLNGDPNTASADAMTFPTPLLAAPQLIVFVPSVSL